MAEKQKAGEFVTAGIPDPIDHVEEGLARLISQFRGLPRVEGWIRAHLELDQKLEDTILDVLLARLLDTCDRTRLRVLGRLVGQGEAGSTLEAFRIFVKGRIAVNRSRGSGKRGPHGVALLLDATAKAFRSYPASITIEMRGDIWSELADQQAATELIKQATGAGIGTNVVFLPTNVFRFGRLGSSSGEIDGTTELGGGWGHSSDPDVGGKFVGVTA